MLSSKTDQSTKLILFLSLCLLGCLISKVESVSRNFNFSFTKCVHFFIVQIQKKNRLNWKNSNIHWKSYTMCVRRLQRFQRIWFNKCEMAILLKIQKSKWVLKKTRILNGFECWTLFFQCYVHCALEMLHLIDGTVGQFHVAGQHTDYMIPHELFQTTIKAFGHCEGLSNWIYLF